MRPSRKCVRSWRRWVAFATFRCLGDGYGAAVILDELMILSESIIEIALTNKCKPKKNRKRPSLARRISS